jgi:hypothetical protein
MYSIISDSGRNTASARSLVDALDIAHRLAEGLREGYEVIDPSGLRIRIEQEDNNE